MKKIFCLLVISIVNVRLQAESAIDNLPLCGVSFDYSERRGYLDFGNGRVEELDKNSLFSGGVMLGKRWKLSRHFRLQATADIKYGSVTGDTLPPLLFNDGQYHSTLIKTSLFYGGCTAELQYPFKVAPDGQWFLLAGAGAHVARVRETEVLLDNPLQPAQTPYAEGDHPAFSASMHGGMGFEIIVSPLFGVAATYLLRYWYPVHYGMTRDYFPLQSIPYSERFLSHEFNIYILVRR
jgi:hypothetical protein